MSLHPIASQTPSRAPLLAALAALAAGCQVFSSPKAEAVPREPMSIEERAFGTTRAGEPVREIVLRNGGLVARLITYGATLRELWVPDRTGTAADVVLGFDDVAGYESERNQYFGCTVGRVANRIALGRFVLDGAPYQLATNNGPNHLHGGVRGFDKRVWAAETHESAAGPAVTFRYTSPAYEEGYPGEVRAQLTYTLTGAGELRIDYFAESDARTPLNMTHHSYFNLAGAGAPTVLDHRLTIYGDEYTPADDTLIPTGEIASVVGTPLDFRAPRRIGERIGELVDGPSIGYDHNFVVAEGARRLSQVATLREPASGRAMELSSTEPGLQFYTGNFLFGQSGKGGRAYAQRSALCLEPQHFPDSVNHPGFPSTVIDPDQPYRQTSVHRFLAE